jgi:hypothetical protein
MATGEEEEEEPEEESTHANLRKNHLLHLQCLMMARAEAVVVPAAGSGAGGGVQGRQVEGR